MQSTIILRRSRGLRDNGMKTYVKEIIRCLYLNLKLSVPLLKYPLATWYVIMAQYIDMPVSGSPEPYWYLLRAQINFPGQQIVYPVCRPVLDMLNDVTQPFFWPHIVQTACADQRVQRHRMFATAVGTCESSQPERISLPGCSRNRTWHSRVIRLLITHLMHVVNTSEQIASDTPSLPASAFAEPSGSKVCI